MPAAAISSWPLSGPEPDGRLLFSTDERSVRESLWHILLTRPGERIMRPGFGAGLEQFIHEPNDETNRRLIASVVTQAIVRWEPRVDLEQVVVLPFPDDPRRIAVTIRYRLRRGGQVGEVLIPLAGPT